MRPPRMSSLRTRGDELPLLLEFHAIRQAEARDLDRCITAAQTNDRWVMSADLARAYTRWKKERAKP